MTDEISILRQYAQTGNEAAFRRLVDHYINIVYAAAKRQVADQHLAEDVTQAVFTLLAQKALALPEDRPLSAWLLKTTSDRASNLRRSCQRRLAHESRAAAMNSSVQSDENEWESVAPMLDQGLERLRRGDRELLLWRYFEGKSVGQIAMALNISEDAASKRIGRAIVHLRDFFRRRGATVSAVALGTFLSSQISEAAPAGLAPTVSAGAISTISAAGTSAAKGVILMTATAKLKIAVAAGIVALLGIGGAIAVMKHAPAPAMTADLAPKPIAPSSGQPAHEVVFSDGTRFHVLGIRDEPSADNRWWDVDGREVPEPSYRISSQLSVNGIASRNLRIISALQAKSLPNKSVRLDVAPSMSYVSSDAVQGNRLMMVQVVSVPSAASTATFRVGLAGGPWTDLVIYDVATSKPAGLTQSPVSVGSITEENGKTIVHTFDSRWSGSDEQETVVVVVNDQIIWSGQMQKTLLTGTARQFTCAKDQVRQVIFRHRPYEWIEMKNVSLRPTTMPTDVQIAAATSATTEPAR